MIGPCAKRRTFATLVLLDGSTYSAENLCDNAQSVCPRAPGEGYLKCRTVCQQRGHAEQQALDLVPDHKDTEGATVFVHHHYACDACSERMTRAGVRIVCTAPVDSERTPNP